MKMQHTVAAPQAGTVAELSVRVGDQVAAGEVLAVVSTGSTDDETGDETGDGDPRAHTQEEGDA